MSFRNSPGLAYLPKSRRRRRGPVVAVVAVVVLAVLAGVLVATGTIGDRGFPGLGGDDAQADATVPNLPQPRPAPPALAAHDDTGGDPQAPVPTAPGLAGALSPLLKASSLAGASATVVDPATGEVLYDRAGSTPATPASTAKLATSVAVLAALGPQARLTTQVVQGARPGQVVLVGGGDPTLTVRPAPKGGKARTDSGYPVPARLADLAAATARALKQAGTSSVRLSYDDSLFSGPPASPAWEASYVRSGVVARVTALTVDEARLRPRTEHGTDPRSQNPSRSAALAFARLLRTNGVRVTGTPVRATAPEGAQRLAAVSSPPMSALVEQTLTVSDNDLAEALARQVAVAKGQPATFAGAAAAIRQVLAGLGVDTAGMTTYDGSGLSRRDRIPARVLGQVLATAASPRHPELRAALTGLPVAGFTGTLADRFDAGTATKAAGLVRAKTGTLSGVSTLAGLTEDADGRLLAFAFMADQVPPAATGKAPAALDRLAAALAACGCR